MALLSVQFSFAQHALTYQSYAKGVVDGDTTTVNVIENARCLKINTQEKRISNPIPGYAQSTTYVDYALDSVYTIVEFADGKFLLRDINEDRFRNIVEDYFGKSMLAGAIAHKLMREYLVQVEFRQWHTIYTRLQMLRDNEKDYYNYLEMLQTVQLLVIDEIAVDNTKLSDAQMRDLGMILRSRKNNGKNTIIISNANPEVIPRLIGDFCWESIKNYSLIFPYEVPGRNRRVNSLGTYTISG